MTDDISETDAAWADDLFAAARALTTGVMTADGDLAGNQDVREVLNDIPLLGATEFIDVLAHRVVWAENEAVSAIAWAGSFSVDDVRVGMMLDGLGPQDMADLVFQLIEMTRLGDAVEARRSVYEKLLADWGEEAMVYLVLVYLRVAAQVVSHGVAASVDQLVARWFLIEQGA